MMTPMLVVAVAIIIFIYYKYTDFYKKRLLPNLSWACALSLSTVKAWELAIQTLIYDVSDQALIAKSELLLMHVDSVVTISLTIALALTFTLFLPKQFGKKK